MDLIHIALKDISSHNHITYLQAFVLLVDLQYVWVNWGQVGVRAFCERISFLTHDKQLSEDPSGSGGVSKDSCHSTNLLDSKTLFNKLWTQESTRDSSECPEAALNTLCEHLNEIDLAKMFKLDDGFDNAFSEKFSSLKDIIRDQQASIDQKFGGIRKTRERRRVEETRRDTERCSMSIKIIVNLTLQTCRAYYVAEGADLIFDACALWGLGLRVDRALCGPQGQVSAFATGCPKMLTLKAPFIWWVCVFISGCCNISSMVLTN